jgi:hypothetical protein
MHRAIPFFVIVLAACSAASQREPRYVRDNVLVSTLLPPIEVRVSKDFRYVGSFPFEIGSIAAGERYVFADVDGGLVRRMVIAQFESFLPSSDEIYRYDFTRAREWNGYRVRENEFAYNEPRYSREHPGNEGALTAAFLRRQGLQVPAEWMVSRFVMLGDETRKHELILFYLEDLRLAGASVDEMYDGDEPTAKWNALRVSLRDRALAAIEIQAR